MVKKINGVLSAIMILLCFDHLGCMAALLLEKIPFREELLMSGKLMVVILVIHGIYGLTVHFRNEIRNKKAAGNQYVKENFTHYWQVYSGMVLIGFLILHLLTIPEIQYRVSILPTVLFICFAISIVLHNFFSVPKMLITFGIPMTKKSGKILCAVLLTLLTLFAVAVSAAGIGYWMGGVM